MIDYLTDMVGIDHVAIGTDYTEGQPREFFDWLLKGRSKKGPAMVLDYPIKLPKRLESAAEFPRLTDALIKRGYAESDVRKIMGENMVNLFREVWIN